MNGVIYARYSCDRQTENSILGQVRECTDFARKEGINIVRIYKDEAISGRTATKRPGFMQMINEAAHDAKRTVQFLDFRIQAPDHPALLESEEQLYL